jgi:serine protease AprX
MSQHQIVICPLCNDEVDKLVYRFHIDNERVVIDKIIAEHPVWKLKDGLCGRCVDYYHTEIVMEQRLIPAVGPYFPVKSVDDFVILPTALRVDADPRFTGKGITVCFIDSGFYQHPDLVKSSNRIKEVIDITVKDRTYPDMAVVENSCWHGTMTSVVCAGDGYLSRGLYKGIASDAELVLIKVQNAEGKITTENIVKALQWILEHHLQYGIRIVNLSLSDDAIGSYRDSEVDLLAEALIEKGITVVAAVGNNEYGEIHPPANSIRVIAVGGVDDDNKLFNKNNQAYHSSYGKTVDGFMKPELVAHAIWIAAPILPGTVEKKEAETLFALLMAEPNILRRQLENCIQHTKLPHALFESNDTEDIKSCILKRIQSAKYISPDFMHVDGTSFAAPIVCSVIAQLLEANPALQPMEIRHILFSTAQRIPGVAPERQGFGMMRPRNSLFKILKRATFMNIRQSPFINREENTIEFYAYSDSAEQISLSGSFNHWAKAVLLLEPGKNGVWKITIPMLPAGRYSYKFCIDERIWMEDVDNPYREPDGFSGFNSIFTV